VIRSAVLLASLLLPLAGEDEWTGVERVVAIGDLHGDYDQFVAVLRSAGLVDEKDRWSGGKAHLVQTGDVLDRGPDSRRLMDLILRLEGEAKQAGGAVHALIGNHEAMNVYGDLRYAIPEEFEAFRDADSEKTRAAYCRERGLKPGQEPPLGFVEHRREHGPAGKYGRWILGHNAVIRIDDTLFLHGGISAKYASTGIRKLNERIRAELSEPSALEGGVVADDEGPLWYRGLAQGDEASGERDLETILKNYGVRRIVIGHTYTEGAIVPRFGGRVLQIDIGLSRFYDPRRRMSCLVIEKGIPHALHRGKKLELPGPDDAALLRYFEQAAELDPSPSPLSGRLVELRARLAVPSKK
jgi:hypothetical protein